MCNDVDRYMSFCRLLWDCSARLLFIRIRFNFVLGDAETLSTGLSNRAIIRRGHFYAFSWRLLIKF